MTTLGQGFPGNEVVETAIPDDWIKHDGKGMPVGEDDRVVVLFPDAFAAPEIRAGYWHGKTEECSSWLWPNGVPTKSRIIAYRVVKP